MPSLPPSALPLLPDMHPRLGVCSCIFQAKKPPLFCTAPQIPLVKFVILTLNDNFLAPSSIFLPSPAELESGKKELQRSQEELVRKIEHQFTGEPAIVF